MQTKDQVVNFFTFLQTYRIGIFVLLWVLVVLVFLIQWLAWIFARGRFRPQVWMRSTGTGTSTGTGDGGTAASSRPLYYVFSEAIVKIINDFRHLLALIVVVIFAIALMFVLIQTRNSIESMKEALTAVVATLGGLVGSIIGYYFGESTVTKAATMGADGGAGGMVSSTGAAVQGPPDTSKGGGKGDIKAAPTPPGTGTGGTGSGSSSDAGAEPHVEPLGEAEEEVIAEPPDELEVEPEDEADAGGPSGGAKG